MTNCNGCLTSCVMQRSIKVFQIHCDKHVPHVVPGMVCQMGNQEGSHGVPPGGAAGGPSCCCCAPPVRRRATGNGKAAAAGGGCAACRPSPGVVRCCCAAKNLVMRGGSGCSRPVNMGCSEAGAKGAAGATTAVDGAAGAMAAGIPANVNDCPDIATAQPACSRACSDGAGGGVLFWRSTDSKAASCCSSRSAIISASFSAAQSIPISARSAGLRYGRTDASTSADSKAARWRSRPRRCSLWWGQAMGTVNSLAFHVLLHLHNVRFGTFSLKENW